MGKYKILVKGIVTHNDKYLLVQKWYDDRIIEPYQWEFIDGKVQFGETPDKAVIRIILEQTGLFSDIDRILYTWSFMVGDICNIGIAYCCSCIMGDVMLSEDLIDCIWVEKEQLKDYIGNQAILDDLARVEL